MKGANNKDIEKGYWEGVKHAEEKHKQALTEQLDSVVGIIRIMPNPMPNMIYKDKLISEVEKLKEVE
jgi:hypothetical protein